MGKGKGRIVAGVMTKLASPCLPPTASGRQVIERMSKGLPPASGKFEVEDQTKQREEAVETYSDQDFGALNEGSDQIVDLDPPPGQ